MEYTLYDDGAPPETKEKGTLRRELLYVNFINSNPNPHPHPHPHPRPHPNPNPNPNPKQEEEGELPPWGAELLALSEACAQGVQYACDALAQEVRTCVRK